MEGDETTTQARLAAETKFLGARQLATVNGNKNGNTGYNCNNMSCIAVLPYPIQFNSITLLRINYINITKRKVYNTNRPTPQCDHNMSNMGDLRSKVDKK